MSKPLSMQLDPVYLEELHRTWQKDPRSLDPSWQHFFQGFELASCPRSCTASPQAQDQSRVASLIYNYRDQGFRLAHTNPLRPPPARLPELELESFGFSDKDLTRVFDTGHLPGPQRATLNEILKLLRETYCGPVGVEYLHIHDVAVRRWLQSQMEPSRNRRDLPRARQLEILEQLIDAELLETFIQRHYMGTKRFSLEGSETLIPLLHAVVERAPEAGLSEIVLGMSHRGRLNVLANLLDKSYAAIFSEFEDNFLADSVGGDGDVKYHKGYSSDHQNSQGKTVHLSLTANPSHLEAVDPVVLGRVRAKQRQHGDSERRKQVLPLLVHGDAAFAGQGLVAETFNLSRLDGYQVGGTIHVVVNNQIGFTTAPEQSRSTDYATDIAKMVEAPIFHVNGDDPEAAVAVAELALKYRQEFGLDVVVDLVCYRRHGHSEGDEPAFTQPRLYRKIRKQTPVRQLYSRQLVEAGVISAQEMQGLTRRFTQRLDTALKQAKEGQPEPMFTGTSTWDRLQLEYSDAPVETAVSAQVLDAVARGVGTIPEGFHLNPKVARLLPKRLAAVEQRGNVDWAFAEVLAFGSLLLEGVPIRLSGQDSERGTFSQRHAVWRDIESEDRYIPLNNIGQDQAKLCVYNSPLSEASVLGFDYGYSLTEPGMQVIWEAQFGDFANGAQVIIDQFIVAAQAKWERSSGLVMLLPHGYEGQGPEHSNAYLERYLAACAEENMQVCYPTTPAQYFHLLRRQMKRPFRRPLIMMAPKSLLRHPRVVSPVEELTQGRFAEVLSDPAPSGSPRRLVLCSGKLFYDLLEARDKEQLDHVSLARVEQLYPFPAAQLEQIARQGEGRVEVVWAQEEPRNRGAWSYIAPRLKKVIQGREIEYVGRPDRASPATGSLRRHRQEQSEIVRRAMTGTITEEGEQH